MVERFYHGLKDASQIDILVGYFYFSGFSLLLEDFQELGKNDPNLDIVQKFMTTHMRILVGMDAEVKINHLVEYFSNQNNHNHDSNQNIRRKFLENLVKIINHTDYLDSSKKQKFLKIFIQKLKAGTLEIRKTKESHHAKLYLFHKKSSDDREKGVLVTGSSNFTSSGFKRNNELNLELRNPQPFEEGANIFSELWRNAIPLVDENLFDMFEEKVLKETWVNQTPSPYLVYIKVLHEFFENFGQKIHLPGAITSSNFKNLRYQTDAIKQAMAIIKKHHGVIISDVVGLGKSIIASAVAHNLNLKTIIIAPPHLKNQWENEYTEHFGLQSKVFGSGSLDKAIKYVDKYEKGKRVVIIDEIHKYRNERTQTYSQLHRLCQGNYVIGLSATPVSNRPGDVFSLLKLFQIPTAPTIKGVGNLSQSFANFAKKYDEIIKKDKNAHSDSTYSRETKAKLTALSRKMQEIMRPVMIRRTRQDLKNIKTYAQDLKKVGYSFPTVDDPIALEFDLQELSDLYISTLDKFHPLHQGKGYSQGFQAARYKPVSYLKDFKKYRKRIEKEFGDYSFFESSQKNLAIFMRRMLVRRFESSLNAFKVSLDNMIDKIEEMKAWYQLGKVPIYKKGDLPDPKDLLDPEMIDEEDLNNFGGLDLESNINLFSDDKIAQFEEKGFFFIDSKEIKVAFLKDMDRDLKLLNEIKAQWFSTSRPDYKFHRFLEEINKHRKLYPGRKIVIFSEYTATTHYLIKQLKAKGITRVINYDSQNSSPARIQKIRANFDAGLPPYEQQDDYDILVATDAISEGFSLHRAGTIINYDIPYNPTRIIQRLGRINRINKKMFDRLFLYNFFPTPHGEKEINIKKYATLKKSFIDAFLGSDVAILSKDEELKTHFTAEIKKKIHLMEGEESWDTKYLNELNNVKQNNKKEIFQKAVNLPRRTRIKRSKKIKPGDGVMVYGKKDGESIFRYKAYQNDLEGRELSFQEAIGYFKCEPAEKSSTVSEQFYQTYDYLKDHLFNESNLAQGGNKGGVKKAVHRINALLRTGNIKGDNLDYLKLLLRVINEYKALPYHHSRTINKTFVEGDYNKIISEFKQEVPYHYLEKIQSRIQTSHNSKELVILTEEFNRT